MSLFQSAQDIRRNCEDRMNLTRDIHATIKEEEARRQKHKDQQQQEEISSKSYKLFSEGKTSV